MSFTKVTKDYEILIRFNENDKIGMQKQTITTVKDDDEVLSSKLDSVEPITLQELQELVAAWTDEDLFVPEIVEEAE